MNLWKAVWCGALLWVLVFFEVSILMFGFGMEGNSIYYVHYVVGIILALLAAMIYFKHQNSDYLQGFYLGLVFVIVGLVLDAVITVPLFVKDYSFFLNGWMWISILEGLIVTTLYGGLRKY